MRLTFALALFLSCMSSLVGQQLWQSVSAAIPTEEGRTISAYHATNLNFDLLQQQLKAAPMEFSVAAKNQRITVDIPMPDGAMQAFKMVESPVMEAGIAARYPELKSYSGSAEDGTKLRMSVSSEGIHASVNTKAGIIILRPMSVASDTYISYYFKDVHYGDTTPAFHCGFQADEVAHGLEHFSDFKLPNTNEKSGVGTLQLRTYRFALSATSAFSSRNGGTTASVMTVFNRTMNLLNSVMENEVAMRMVLIDRTDELIFTSSSGEPYGNVREGGRILGQAQEVFNNIIPANSYDVGHVFTATCDDTGGIASRGSACQSFKANGVTCNYRDFEYNVLAIMAHELGHQFNATHTMNNCTEGSQIEISNGYEVGSGSTIMSYAGVCDAANNIQAVSDPYYHVASLEEMIQHARVSNSGCGTLGGTSNNEPTIALDYEDGFYIPLLTPFKLTAKAEDADGDDLTYCWEQYNTGPPSPVGSPLLNAAAFRSYPPSSSGTRFFPRKPILLIGNSEDTEVLASFARDYTFRCTVRDNNSSGGAAVWDEMSFHAAENTGPFSVSYPTAAQDSMQAGKQYAVRWNVANTDNSRVNCQRVNILLSTNGGNNFSIRLLENVANDGEEIVTIPEVATTQARIMVEAADNIFYNVSRQNFVIEAATEPSFALSPMPFYQQVCLPAAASVDIQTTAIAGFEGEIALSVENLPEGVTATFEPASVMAGESATLSLDMNNTTFDGLTQVQVVGMSADGSVMLSQAVEFNIVSNDFSALSLTFPENGERSIVGNTMFEWTETPNALSYDFELSSSPAFEADAIVASATGITSNSFMPESIFLDESTIFYWRVRPNNECGAAAYSIANVFQTVNVQCVPFENNEAVPITGSGRPTVQSKINIDASGSITDLNIPIITGRYSPINAVQISLISPAGTTAKLFSNNCGGTPPINIGFDDEAPDPIDCPPTSGIVHQPIEPLSIFDGENIQGEWTLQFEVTRSGFGDGGSIDKWQLESCASIEANAPFLVRNEVFDLPPASRSQIWLETLQAEDEDNTTDEIIYELLSVPQHGTLYLRETALALGDSFTQQDIDGYRLSYEHNGNDASEDNFNFIIRDTDGGWYGPDQFNILIDENAMVGTNDPALAQQINIYPNPASAQVHIALGEGLTQQVQVRVLNLNGQHLNSTSIRAGNLLTLDTAKFADGIYFIQVYTAKVFYTERVVIQK